MVEVERVTLERTNAGTPPHTNALFLTLRSKVSPHPRRVPASGLGLMFFMVDKIVKVFQLLQ